MTGKEIPVFRHDTTYPWRWYREIAWSLPFFAA